MGRAGLRPFTPSREEPEALVSRTVGRELLLRSVERRLLTAATTKNRSHTLVVGPRGSGKTHVLSVALHRLRQDPRQRQGLVVARVDEDVVGIATYADLVLHVARSLGIPPEAARPARTGREVVAVEAAITAHLAGRALILVIENLSRVFESIGRSGQQDFRSFVETSGDVLLLASTPLLFKAVVSRSEPWFGSFAIEHLRELTLDEGIELLRRLAVQDGDEAFATFILSPTGRARLAALHHLAGGSPRLWMVLAGCASVELLDELAPAVEQLLENLVAYYQQRLWELPGNEQKLVRELGTGPASTSVAELADRCGLDERTAASALGRLAEAGWVRSEKVPGTDQRRSWYRLREPLLRHHFQYRQADGEPLRLIVDILRLWFDPGERRARLAAVPPSSVAERHLLATLPLDPPQRSDAAFVRRDVDRLLGEARCWISDPDAVGSPEAGMLLEAAVVALKESPAASRAALEARDAPAAVRVLADELGALAAAQARAEPLADRLGTVLDAAAAAATSWPEHPLLELTAASWNGSVTEPALTADRLEALLARDLAGRLRLTIRDEHAFWVGLAGRHSEAVQALTAVLDERLALLPADHPDVLSTRSSLGDQLGYAGRHGEAVDALAAAAEGRTRALGASHPDTLSTRRSLCLQLVEAGRHREAIDALTAVLDDHAGLPTHSAVPALRRLLVDQLVGQDRLEEAVAPAMTAVDQAAAGLGGDDDQTWKAAEVLFVPLLGLLREGRPIPAVDARSAAARQVLEVVREMEAAREGRGEGGARLPTELRSLVDELRAGGEKVQEPQTPRTPQKTAGLEPSGATQ